MKRSNYCYVTANIPTSSHYEMFVSAVPTVYKINRNLAVHKDFNYGCTHEPLYKTCASIFNELGNRHRVVYIYIH